MAIDPFFGSVLGAAGNLAGGLIGANNANAINERAANEAAANRNLQMDFARTALTWKARDAMQAYKDTGIHPLALIGVNGPTYSPVSSAFVSSPMGEAVGRMGQDISRGMHATADRSLREAAVNMQEQALANSAERGKLENELLRLQIDNERSRMSGQTTPARPRVGASEGEILFPGVERQINPDVSVARTPRGGYVVVPGKAVQERMEEMFGLGPEWFARNRAWLATPEARSWVQKFLPKAPYSTEWNYHAPTGEWLPNYLKHDDWHTRRRDAEIEGMRRKGRSFDYMFGE